MKLQAIRRLFCMMLVTSMLQGIALAQNATPNGSEALPRPPGVEPDVAIGMKKGERALPDGRPQFQVPRVAINPNLPTLWIIGDSTVRNGSYEDAGNGQWGWGRPIRYWFDETKINVQNRAVGGTTSLSFQETHWPWILKEMKPGDFLIAQFGHNDAQTPKGNDDELHPVAARGGGRGARGGGRGARGAASAPASAPAPQMLHTFGWYMRKYVTDAKEKGVVWAAICSPIPRDRWTGDTITPDSWDDTCKAAADQAGAAFIDLNRMTIAKYTAMGQQKVVDELFPANEPVHTSWAGAVLNAQTVVEGLKQTNSPLVKYLKPEPPTDLTNPWGKAR
jgi:lysophospholipase L1-like esterase